MHREAPSPKPAERGWLSAARLTALAVLLAACGGPDPDNPFVTTGTGGGGSGTGGEGGSTVDPELGDPCVDDQQCDDAIACTTDSCDKDFDRCRHHPEPSTCDNGVHCDGAEVCDLSLGCIAGAPRDCGDDNFCTIDTCVEESQSCRHDPRDADSDGDPDAHCPEGGDCDDLDPEVSSQREEVCANVRDDDCDGEVDEADCATPENDTCTQALEIASPGTFSVSTFGAALDYATSCAPAGAARDVVAAIVLPAGPPVDVKVRARTQAFAAATAMAEQCGQAATELACGAAFGRPTGGFVSKLRARSIGSPDGGVALPLYVTSVEGTDVTLEVDFVPPEPAPANETCGTAEPLSVGGPVEVEILDAAKDLSTACVSLTGELVYAIEVEEVSDLDLRALSTDGDGQVSLSLRSSSCALPEDELACHTAPTAKIFRHSLEPGTYYVAVSATAPTTVSLAAAILPATPTPPDEDCSSSAALEIGVTTDVDYFQHQDDHSLSCAQPSVDVAYALEVEEASDVLLVSRLSSTDFGALGLSSGACEPQDLLACATSGRSPLRARRRNLAPGDYRVIAESFQALPQQLTAFVRDAAPATFVVFADGCADAVKVPATGGFFQGNTSNSTADFNAGCDSAGGLPGGAKDQLLELELTSTKRVILDMSGSTYATLLDVRKGPSCPGTEVSLACSATIANSPSYLDLELEAGTYYLQIDGLGGATGPWMLDVYVVDP